MKDPNKLYRKITIQHMEESIDWARKQVQKFGVKNRFVIPERKPTPIDGTKCAFNMGDWHCGTEACLAGGAAIAAGYSMTRKAPGQSFPSSIAHTRASDMFYKLQYESESEGERLLADAFEMTGDELGAIEQAAEACRLIRKERGLPTKTAERREKVRNA